MGWVQLSSGGLGEIESIPALEDGGRYILQLHLPFDPPDFVAGMLRQAIRASDLSLDIQDVRLYQGMVEVEFVKNPRWQESNWKADIRFVMLTLGALGASFVLLKAEVETRAVTTAVERSLEGGSNVVQGAGQVAQGIGRSAEGFGKWFDGLEDKTPVLLISMAFLGLLLVGGRR